MSRIVPQTLRIFLHKCHNQGKVQSQPPLSIIVCPLIIKICCLLVVRRRYVAEIQALERYRRVEHLFDPPFDLRGNEMVEAILVDEILRRLSDGQLKFVFNCTWRLFCRVSNQESEGTLT